MESHYKIVVCYFARGVPVLRSLEPVSVKEWSKILHTTWNITLYPYDMLTLIRKNATSTATWQFQDKSMKLIAKYWQKDVAIPEMRKMEKSHYSSPR